MSGKHFNKYHQKYHKFFFFAIALVLLYACSTTRKVPDGEYLLTKNNFKYEDGKIFGDEIPDYVLQKPNKKVAYFLPLSLIFYNWATPKYDSILTEYMTYPREIRNQRLLDSLFIKYRKPEYKGRSLFTDRVLHNIGKPPVILDQARTEKSAENIRKFLVYRGYWDANVKFKNNLDSAAKKATVDYLVTHKDPTFIKDYYYNIPDLGIKSIYEENLRKTLVKKGDILNQKVLEQEVGRLNDLMRERGYYRFNSGNDEVYFTADSLESRKQVPVTLEIHKDSLDTKRFKIATIGNIDVAVVEHGRDFKRNTEKDSLMGINFHKIDNQYKTMALWRQVILETGEVYKQKNFDLTKRNLLALNNFSILKSRDSLRRNGNVPPNDSIVDVLYLLKPLPKYELKIAADLNYSQILSLSAAPSVNLTSRNVFGGAENLSFGIGGTFGSVINSKDPSTRTLAYELAAQASLNFPRLLLPFKYYKLIPKRYSPSSSLFLGTSVQNNIGLGRINFNAGLNYFANVNDLVSHKLTIFNTQLSFTQDKNRYYDFFPGDNAVRAEIFDNYVAYNPTYNINQDWDKVSSDIINDTGYNNQLDADGKNLMNEFRQSLINKDRQTQDVLIASLIYNFTYNEIGKKEYENPFYFNGKVELAGNVFSLLNNRKNQNGVISDAQREIFKIPYSQFVKFDFDIRKYFTFFEGKHTLVLRQFIGLGIPYGNSQNMPFVRSYFNGGSNDIRAWKIFGGLGPADSQLDERVRAYIMDNVKLTTNVEYRFPLTKVPLKIDGAVFTDAGNIWSFKDSGFGDQFKFNRFLTQMGVGSGLGIRMQIAYITIRFDAAYKVYDPNKPSGNRWVIGNTWKPVWNFAFGFPF